MRKSCSTCLFDDVCPFDDVCEYYSPAEELDPNSIEYMVYWENRFKNVLIDEWSDYISDYSDTDDVSEEVDSLHNIKDVLKIIYNADGSALIVYTDGTMEDVLY